MLWQIQSMLHPFYQTFIRVTCSQNAMFHWAMQYGTSVEVIEPADLRERIRNAVNEMAERYK